MFKKKAKASSEVSSCTQPVAKTTSEANGSGKLDNAEPRLTLHIGVPGTASVFAYEPGQRLLAIASSDGRIKVFGREGVEVLLLSPTRAPCRFLEFVNNDGRIIHVTTRNDIEVWDLSSRELVSYRKWEAEVTAFSVLQGSPFLYIGDETGQVTVLYSHQDLLDDMAYTIPAQMTLCGLSESGDESAPSVVSILPQPGAVYSRVVIVYANGLIVLWGLHEVQVLAIRGGTQEQHTKLTDGYGGENEGEEDKEICCACWACPSGSILAVGYTDGDIYLWSVPVNSKAKSDKLDLSRSPIMRLSLSSEDFKMPVVVLRWSASSKAEKGPNGYLYVFGGQEMGVPEAVTIVPVQSPESQLQLQLPGPFADLLVLSNAGVILVLSSPGCLEVYEPISISPTDEKSLPSVPFKHALTSAVVKTAKCVALVPENHATGYIRKLSKVLKSYVPPVLPSGTRWPINGGHVNDGMEQEASLYITGDDTGCVHIWEASTNLYFLATIKNEEFKGSSITAIDFCPVSGILAIGNDEGLVCMYTLGAEATESTVHVVTTDEHLTRKESHHAEAFRCFAILRLHQAAITSVLVASGISCLAIGDERGMISFLDLDSCSLRFNGRCLGNAARIISFTALAVPSSRDGTSSSTTSIVFVLAREADVFAMDGSTGAAIVAARPRNPSSAISLHFVDSSGASIKSLDRASSKKSTKQSVILQVIQTDDSGPHINLESGSEEREEDVEEDDDWKGPNSLLLLCSEDSLRLYSTSALLKGVRTTIRKVRLEKPCCSAAVFQKRGNGSGLFLLYTTGELEIRSLPHLDLLKETTLSSCVGSEIHVSRPSFRDTLSVSFDGRLGAIDGNRELFFMSLFKEEHDVRSLPGPHPLLYDRDVAAATEAALSASSHVAAKKKNQFQDLLGGVMKELKQTLAGNTATGDRSAQELSKLFARQFFPPGSSSRTSRTEQRSTSRTPTTKGSTSSSPQIGSPVEEASLELDIDDIDLDEDDSHSPSPSGGTSKKSGVIKKLRNSFKGKKKASRSPVPPDEEEERNMLFEGGSTESKKPAVRSADEIKAAYGHKKAGEASSAAAHARDRLMERQEKLQNINKRTEEMQEGAENFASLAEELAKKMAAKKWWEI